eukprot:GEZU01015793.1.p1 GENE.GEZU01015793.1~~GEZU01015793.1.p1  ORF type:complete len:424 (-),score=118.16 GEZU01015793.1:487-1758(-)
MVTISKDSTLSSELVLSSTMHFHPYRRNTTTAGCTIGNSRPPSSPTTSSSLLAIDSASANHHHHHHITNFESACSSCSVKCATTMANNSHHLRSATSTVTAAAASSAAMVAVEEDSTAASKATQLLNSVFSPESSAAAGESNRIVTEFIFETFVSIVRRNYAAYNNHNNSNSIDTNNTNDNNKVYAAGLEHAMRKWFEILLARTEIAPQTFIIALMYLERFIQNKVASTTGSTTQASDLRHRSPPPPPLEIVFLACIILAAKVNEDAFMHMRNKAWFLLFRKNCILFFRNMSYAQFNLLCNNKSPTGGGWRQLFGAPPCGGNGGAGSAQDFAFTSVQRLNEVELEVLSALKFDLCIHPSELIKFVAQKNLLALISTTTITTTTQTAAAAAAVVVVAPRMNIVLSTNNDDDHHHRAVVCVQPSR